MGHAHHPLSPPAWSDLCADEAEFPEAPADFSKAFVNTLEALAHLLETLIDTLSQAIDFLLDPPHVVVQRIEPLRPAPPTMNPARRRSSAGRALHS